MEDSWVTVGAFPTVIEAELARNRLAEEGIEAQVTDAVANTMLWVFSSGGVKVLVPEEHAQRAAAILLRINRGRPDRRDDYGLEANITNVPDKVSVPGGEKPPEDEEDDEEEARDSAKDVIARRAWRAAVFGMFFCPGFFHVFSAFSLLEIPEAQGELTPAGRNYILGALAIDALALIFIVAIVISAYVR